MIPPSQSEQIKKQLVEQIGKTFPAAQQQQAIQQINNMSDEELEQFLIQNNLIKDAPPSTGAGEQFRETNGTSKTSGVGSRREAESGPPPCIFCAIKDGQIPSYKLDENKDSIAVLEINPVSKGHSLVIPKEHSDKTENIPQTAFSLAKKIAKKIKTKFKPKEINIASSNSFGHAVINVVPIYGDESPNAERKKASPEELEKLQKHLEKKSRATPKPKKPKKPKKVQLKKPIILPKRIP